jgi:sensor histidine kinase regulating citrate/malate metabolism
MIKNALEAEPIGGSVTVRSKIKNGNFYLTVTNSVVIPDEMKLQIFQRSISTKGQGRGIGTYSMKLISGQYLKEIISFVSNNLEGMTFTLKMPQSYLGL